jgi:hypothetical protein
MSQVARSIVTAGVTVGLAVVVAVAVAACQGAPRASTVVQLEPLNASGVTGSVTLVDAGEGRTQVQVRVEPAGNLDMPAHIHPGSCDDLIPQPKHPLENVVNGISTTIVRATLAELTSGGLAVNLHKSNQDLKTYTACAEL